MAVYIYKGPVESKYNCLEQWWEAETTAETESKARSNLAYRYRRDHDIFRGTAIKLPGKLVRKEN